MNIELRAAEGTKGLQGRITPPPDKSISHRAVILSSLAEGRSIIRNLLRSEDVMSTVNSFRALGVDISVEDEVVIEGRGLYGLSEPLAPIDCGNSGTTMRLMAGVLSGSSMFSVLTGDESLSRRPMKRVIDPLRSMGAVLMARKDGNYPPIAVRGGGLRGVRYDMPVASAQVKSALLLAGLYAEGETEVVEKVKSRDHTERMLPAYGARVLSKGLSVGVEGGSRLHGMEFDVPNDFSSAAFFIAAALMVKGSELVIKDVGINPTRTGLLRAVEMMGGKLQTENERMVSGEPVADILVRASELSAVDIGGAIGPSLPSLIDEFPVLCVLAARAEGTTIIRGAGELRVKESDRISSVAQGLRAMGVLVDEFDDGLEIKGSATLRGAEIESHGDHRIAMAFAVAALAAKGKTLIRGAQAVNISFPDFFEELRKVSSWEGL